ncbi:MAG: riboflavin biosynthesis protein RibF [Planctomycetaceae bacterium]|nr:riboflavin biosynthesis protein RibF [Planctomycetaceae bacterium]
MTAAALFRNLADLPRWLQAGAVSIGNFDGVHVGHAALLERLVARARALQRAAVVFTFDPHPAALLCPDAVPPPLTWTERKVELLTALGVDAVIAYPTDWAILSLTADEFFARILRAQLDVRALVEGPNFFFGRHRRGTIAYLARLCRQAGVELEVVEPLQVDGDYVSSSRIRELIQAGQVGAADQLLTQPYRVQGEVVRGAGRGARLGFPTANLQPVGMVLPPLGVYAGRATLRGATFPAAIHIGPNPTFREDRVKFEIHMVGIDRPLYGETLAVDFRDRLRDIRVFDGIEELQEQLRRDVEAVVRL